MDRDVFLYSGPMRRGADLQFIEFVSENKQASSATLYLTTFGGDPDAAYKMGRYLHQRYDDFVVVVPGLCKSAGTLLAIAANEVAFAPYGELGPLDIQLTKVDNVSGMESGLSILQAFDTLQQQAKQTFHNLIQEIISSTGGIVSFHTASHSASEIIGSLYGPIFARIDPEEVGSRTRAMQIAAAYGYRLNVKFGNLRSNALDTLAQTYPSHGFVIDLDEAQEMFHRVRLIDTAEKKLVEALGSRARFPGTELAIECLTQQYADIVGKEHRNENPAENLEEADGQGAQRQAPEPARDRRNAGARSKAGADEAEAAMA